jgi:acetolactate synthase-1/2/3 large subunit
VQAALQGAGKVATFIAPANHAWDQAATEVPALDPAGLEPVGQDAIEAAAQRLGNGKTSVLFLGGRALREESLQAAGRIAAATGARLVCEVFPARLQRGAGRVAVKRLPYFAEAAAAALEGTEQMILVGTKAPVAFFAYPGKPGWLAPEGCDLHTLASVDQDPLAALQAVADRLNADANPEVAPRASGLPAPTGPLSPAAIGESVTRTLPDDAIIVDEAATCGLGIFPLTGQAAPHDWLTLTGGAIGIGLPLALGASIACPERKVIALQADGSAMYTVQALWTMAREQADVTVVIMNNRSYAILNIELARVGAGQPSAKTLSMLDLSHPDLDFVALAQGMGLRAVRATTAEEFDSAFAQAMAVKGPQLIEAMVVQQAP